MQKETMCNYTAPMLKQENVKIERGYAYTGGPGSIDDLENGAPIEW